MTPFNTQTEEEKLTHADHAEHDLAETALQGAEVMAPEGLPTTADAQTTEIEEAEVDAQIAEFEKQFTGAPRTTADKDAEEAADTVDEKHPQGWEAFAEFDDDPRRTPGNR